jgi:hypothetical protein
MTISNTGAKIAQRAARRIVDCRGVSCPPNASLGCYRARESREIKETEVLINRRRKSPRKSPC